MSNLQEAYGRSNNVLISAHRFEGSPFIERIERPKWQPALAEIISLFLRVILSQKISSLYFRNRFILGSYGGCPKGLAM